MTVLGGSLSPRALSSPWRVWLRLGEEAGIIGPHPRPLLPASPARRRFRAAVHAVMAVLQMEWLGMMGGLFAMPLHMWRLMLVEAGYPARDRGDAEFWSFAFPRITKLRCRTRSAPKAGRGDIFFFGVFLFGFRMFFPSFLIS